MFNFLLYLWYKFYLSPKMIEAIGMIRKYEDRLSSITSNKRRNKVMRAVSTEVQTYTNKLRNYMFFQSFTVIIVYMVGLILVLNYITPPYALFPYASILTPPVDGKPEINNLFIYILSFLLFTPLSLRRPKVL
ncbi:hypothetical protein [Stygiolobus caldivivus]|uniref:hypothetical protein n=1 Tax=Stygiolobus caldivivus TaxID=2824673 RepID=UPI001CECAC83|nr:hypothetical protein [Stygiolobus caldivivus]